MTSLCSPRHCSRPELPSEIWRSDQPGSGGVCGLHPAVLSDRTREVRDPLPTLAGLQVRRRPALHFLVREHWCVPFKGDSGECAGLPEQS